MSADNFMERLIGFDTDMGMMYCGEMEEVYYDVLETYYNESVRAALQELYEQENWAEYALNAHTLKSTSLTIGAEELSEAAKGLELAAKSGDIDYIKQNHDSVMAEYDTCLKQIQFAMS